MTYYQIILVLDEQNVRKADLALNQGYNLLGRFM